LRTDAEIAGELRNAAGEVVAQVDLRDDGQERDIDAHDGVFTARLTPAAEDLAQWNGLIRAKVYGATADGERRSAKTRFYYGAPSAKLTGYYRDQLVDGHLQLLAELEVKQPGDYRLEATLSGSQGLLAWAENTVHFEAGVGSMPVTFWGLTLREANEPGPYRLSSVALSNVSVMSADDTPREGAIALDGKGLGLSSPMQPGSVRFVVFGARPRQSRRGSSSPRRRWRK